MIDERERERLADTEYAEGTVAEDATPGDFISWYEDGFPTGTVGTGWPPDVLVQAHKGDRIRIYGRSEVRGIDIYGQMAFYRTKAEREERHRLASIEHEQRKDASYARDREQMEATLAGLPEVFQRRIARFREHREGWDREYGAYEIMVCAEAVKIADALKTPEAVEKFNGEPWSAQKALVPGLNDGHSGNSFGFAVLLAHMYLRIPEQVVEAHGALTPLVGCQEYGCWHPRVEA